MPSPLPTRLGRKLLIRAARLLLALGLVGGMPAGSSGQGSKPIVKLVEVGHADLSEGPARTRLSNTITAVDHAPDGKILAVALRDPDLVLLIDARSMIVRSRLTGHLAMPSRLVFFPDGETLASAGHDGTIRLWDVAGGRERLLFDQFQGNVRGLAVGPEGRRLYSGVALPGSKGTAECWEVGSQRLLGTCAVDHGIEDLALSPDGSRLATTSRDRTVRLWASASFEAKGTCELDGAFAASIAFTPDGKALVATLDDGTIQFIDPTTMKVRSRIDSGSRSFLMLAISPDGQTIATTAGGRVQLRDRASGAEVGAVADVGQPITAIDFAPDGRTLAVGGLAGALRVFRLDRP